MCQSDNKAKNKKKKRKLKRIFILFNAEFFFKRRDFFSFKYHDFLFLMKFPCTLQFSRAREIHFLYGGVFQWQT